MADKEIAKLIDNINSGAQSMPDVVDKMVHQYVVGTFTEAALMAVLSIILGIITYAFYKQGRKAQENYDECFGWYVAAGSLAAIVLITVFVMIVDISAGLSPITSIIKEIS